MGILSAQDVQNKLGVGRSTVFRLLNTKGAPSFRVGKRLLIEEADLLAWVKGGGAETLAACRKSEEGENDADRG